MIQSSVLKEDIQRAVEGVQNVFSLEGDLSEEDIESLHTQFVDAIELVNDRLRQCDELLRRGYRGEAIQECEKSPHLLDLVSEIDIPEWEAWADYVRQFHIPPQPPLLLHVASALNDAYNDSQSLEEFLRWHRLHALARSPLSKRIEVLRLIATRDPTNVAWQEDLQDYETSRFRQIDAEYRGALRTRDVAALGKLATELSQSSWSVTPPEKLSKSVADAFETFQAENAREKLYQIEKKLNAAFSEFDLRRARLAHDQWNHYQNIAQLGEDDPTVQRLAAAFDWLEEEQAGEERRKGFDLAIRRLERALDNDHIAKSELLRLYHIVERYDEGIPDRILHRLNERLKSIESREHRRYKLVVVTSLAAILTVGLIGGSILRWKMRRDQIARSSQSYAALLRQGRLDEAAQFYERAQSESPFVTDALEMRQLRLEHETLLTEENARLSRLRQLLTTATELIDEGTWESLIQAEQELRKAESNVANGEEELVSINEVRLSLLEKKSLIQDERDATFLKDVERFTEKLTDLEEFDITELRALLSEATRLQSRPSVSSSIQKTSPIGLAIKKLEDRIENYLFLREKEKAFAEVLAAVGGRRTYPTALSAYVQLIKSGSRSRDFETVLEKHLPLLPDIDNWNELAKEWNSLPTLPLDAEAVRRLEMISRLTSEFSEFPGVPAVERLESLYESASRQTASDGSKVTEQIGQMLESFSLPGMQMLEDTDFRRYYFIGMPSKEDNRTFTIRYLTDVRDTLQTEEKTFLKTRVRKISPTQFFTSAPQRALAAQCSKWLDREDWLFEKKVCAVLTVICQEESCDPILRVQMLKNCLDYAVPGSKLLSQEFQRFHEVVTEHDFTNVNWLAPDDQFVLQRRSVAIDVLERLPVDPGVVFKTRVEPYFAQLPTKIPTLPTFAWKAAVFEMEDQWRIIVREGRSFDSAEAFAYGFEPDGTRRFLKIGHWDVTQFEFDSSRLQGELLEGMPTFVTKQLDD